MTKRSMLAVSCMLMASFAQGQSSGEIRLSDLESMGAAKLSKEDLQSLLPGAKVKSLASTGSSRYWENAADGKFVASSDNKAGGLGRSANAAGTWHLGDNGTYCVTLEWKTSTEQWCRYLFKAGDKYYGVKSLANQAERAYEYSFSR